MTHRGGADDEDEADLHEREMPDSSDMDRSDDAEDTQPCPFCGKDIWEKADLCPHCGNFIAFPDLPRRRPVWFWIALVLAFVVMCLSVLLYRS